MNTLRWNPDVYLSFNKERFQPFDDLLGLAQTRKNISIIDLGCGSGELTRRLANHFPESRVIGVDNSPEMLEKAHRFADNRIRFEQSQIEDIKGEWDLVFSNAALHWIGDHEKLIPRLYRMVRFGGQLLLQFPSGQRNPAHRTLASVACEEPYISASGGWKWDFPVLPVERYAEILFEQGGENVTAFDKVYPHVLPDSEAVYRFTSGTTLLAYTSRLPDDLHQSFTDRYRDRLRQMWGASPVFFPFRRILLSGFRPGQANVRA